MSEEKEYGWVLLVESTVARSLDMLQRRLTLNPLTWKIWWAHNNASRWQTGFNSAFKWLMPVRQTISNLIAQQNGTPSYFHKKGLFRYCYCSAAHHQHTLSSRPTPTTPRTPYAVYV